MNPTLPEPEVAHDIGQATAQLQANHREGTTALQQLVDRITALVGQPTFVAVLAVAIIGWVGLNLLAERIGRRPTLPPFHCCKASVRQCRCS